MANCSHIFGPNQEADLEFLLIIVSCVWFERYLFVPINIVRVFLLISDCWCFLENTDYTTRLTPLLEILPITPNLTCFVQSIVHNTHDVGTDNTRTLTLKCNSFHMTQKAHSGTTGLHLLCLPHSEIIGRHIKMCVVMKGYKWCLCNCHALKLMVKRRGFVSVSGLLSRRDMIYAFESEAKKIIHPVMIGLQKIHMHIIWSCHISNLAIIP